jgi:hypothetical protein
MGQFTSCMKVENPEVTLDLTANFKCCNKKSVKIQINDLEKINELLKHVHRISEEHVKRNATV